MKLKKYKGKIRKYAGITIRGWIIFFIVMAVACVICVLLRSVSSSDVHVPLIFVLAVLIISLLTDGYFFGILAALSSVITVNYAFTYPYAKLDFSIYGYPLTFLTMLAVGFVASTLTSRVKEQEKAYMETEKERIHANLLRAVSHDLRTPLTSISGSLAALLDNDQSLSEEAQRELIRNAYNDSEWLCRMVENLLSVTRLGSDGIGRLNKQAELVEEVISAAVVSFKKRIPGVEVSVTVPEEPLFVPMDALLVEQVLLNLMDNAVVHGKNTSAIQINVSEAAGMAVISVEDNGGGIPEDKLEHLFDGTMQSSKNKNGDNHRGMGIGLTVCRSIIQVHGGWIRGENTGVTDAKSVLPRPFKPKMTGQSEEPKITGARFVFALPLGDGE